MNKSDLKELIKEILLDEMTTANGGGAASGDIKTPNAFKPTKGINDDEESPTMKGIAKHSMPPQRDSNIVDELNPAKVNEARSRYLNFRDSDTYKRPKSKVSYAVLEIKKMLKEVEYLVDITNKLKNETGTTESWKRTPKDLAEIMSRVQNISHKMKDFQ